MHLRIAFLTGDADALDLETIDFVYFLHFTEAAI